MGQFSNTSVIEEVGYNQWKVFRGFTYTSETGLVVQVPDGFLTDLASVPRAVKSLVDTPSYWSQAAVVHDVLYYNHRHGMDTTVTRIQADKILVEGMRDKAHAYGVPDADRREYLVLGGVRIGGAASWYTPQETLEWKARQTTDSEVAA